MKVKTSFLNDKVVVFLEDNNKKVEVIGKDFYKDFPSFDVALQWAETEVLNGARNMGNY